MWPFTPWNRQQTPSEPPDSFSAETENPPAELAAQLSQLTADLAGLRLEWAEVLDKINRWASRQAARERKRATMSLDELGQDGPEIAEDTPGGTNGGGADSQSDRTVAKAQLRARAAHLFRRG